MHVCIWFRAVVFERTLNSCHFVWICILSSQIGVTQSLARSINIRGTLCLKSTSCVCLLRPSLAVLLLQTGSVHWAVRRQKKLAPVVKENTAITISAGQLANVDRSLWRSAGSSVSQAMMEPYIVACYCTGLQGSMVKRSSEWERK